MWDPSGPVQSGSPATTDFEVGVTELDTNPDDRSGWWQAVWDGVQQLPWAGIAVLHALGVCSSEPSFPFTHGGQLAIAMCCLAYLLSLQL